MDHILREPNTMSDASRPFDFASFVPGFDFLKNLGAGASPVPGAAGLSNWVAPTLSVEEVDKRIKELKTVQFWLDQNLHALKATIQALEVQKMTLSTLQGMNLRMEDLAQSFTAATRPAAAAAPAAAPEPEAAEAGTTTAPPTGAPGVIDPMQWWGALTQQFEQIAGNAVRDAAQFQMPAALQTAMTQAGEAVQQGVTAAVRAAQPTAPAKKARQRATAAAPAAAAAPRRRTTTATTQRPAAVAKKKR